MRTIAFIVTFLVASFQLQSQTLAQLEAQPNLKSSQWGIAVIDIASGNIVGQHEAARMLSTASVMKAVTAATAYDRLGANFQFDTELSHTGTIESNTLKGDLIIKGSGDPSLGSNRFPGASFLANWAESLKIKGIRSVEGDIVANTYLWSSQISPGSWPWKDMGNYYAAGASALNYQENYYSLFLKAGSRVGAPVTVLRTFPEMKDIKFECELTTGSRGSGDQAYIFGVPYTQVRYLRGTIPLGANSFHIKGAISNPPQHCAQAFREALEQCGITVQGEIRVTQAMVPARGLDEKRSPTLDTLITEMNMHSINLYAEALLKKASGESSTEDATAWLGRFWKEKGVQHAMHFTDGSGLSADNAASPLAIAEILAYASKQSYGENLRKSFPVAGRSGSLKRRFKGTAGEGRIFAKTGTTGHVRSLAGYIHTRSGKRYSFCLMANHFNTSGGRVARTFDSYLAGLAAK
ncbi:MAG: D-alanyl-D-alanine carboxypeptidase/D-alanyl-D-alanine-endopeptidase [Bacteroidia bacterium]